MQHSALLKELYIQANGAIPPHRIAYTEWGNQHKELVVCVHGVTRNSRDFDYLASELATNFHIVSIDMPGRGRSEWLEDKTLYNYDTYVKDILSVIDHLGYKQVYWVGTSMGGILGMILNSIHPHLFKKLILNDIGSFIPKQSLERIAKYIGVTPEFKDLDQAEKHLRKILSPFGITKNEDWRYITLHSVMQKEDGNFTMAYDPGIALNFLGDLTDIDLNNIWQPIQTPILLLRGENSDIFLKETAQEMVNSNKNITFIEFPNIGHAPSLMEKDQIELIQQFLTKSS